MKKYILLIALVLVVLILLVFVPQKKDSVSVQKDYKNISYMISGRNVVLRNGISETEATPGSATKVVTKYFGNEVKKDLNGDGTEDIAFLLTQSTGGSGTFYYLAAAISTSNGYVGSEAVFIGDRIAPQTTESGPGRSVIVNYAERGPGEPMTAQPSVGKSLRLLLDPKTLQFGEVVENFEGEADPNRMTLTMKRWNFESAQYNDGKKVVLNANKFTLLFKNDRTFSATTDCNSVGGKYTTNKGAITLSDISSTLMYCDGSHESEFTTLLSKFQIYHFTSKGELVFDLMYDSGVVIFK